MDYNIFIYIFFGILPSLTWLAYYLRKDVHPEPKKMIMKIFLWGAVITFPVFLIQLGLSYLLNRASNINSEISSLLYWFVVIALSEELFKYLVIRAEVITSPDLDEPVDLIIYMVITALGFAALENILYLFQPAGQMSFSAFLDRTLVITFVRFIGATFLHTLCSALIGYSLVISFYETKEKHMTVWGGILLAALLHGAYDFSIMTLTGYTQIAMPALIIITLALLVFVGLEKLKEIKSVCVVKPEFIFKKINKHYDSQKTKA